MLLVLLVLPASPRKYDETDHAENAGENDLDQRADDLGAAEESGWGTEMDKISTLSKDTTNESHSSRGGEYPPRNDKPVGLMGLRHIRTLLVMFTILSVRSVAYVVHTSIIRGVCPCRPRSNPSPKLGLRHLRNAMLVAETLFEIYPPCSPLISAVSVDDASHS